MVDVQAKLLELLESNADFALDDDDEWIAIFG